MKKIIQMITILILLIIPVISIGARTKTYDIIPNEGYRIVDVIVNGVSKGPITSYTFTEMAGKQTLKVITAKIREGYTVTFDANGGSGTMNPQVFEEGVASNLSLNTYTKEGYAFNGWSTTAGGAAAYTDGASYTATGNATLYAVWGRYADVNDDGKVNNSDFILYRGYLSDPSIQLNKINADVNIDNIIDIYDVCLLKEFYYGKQEALPAYTGKVVYFEGNNSDNGGFNYQLYGTGETKALTTNSSLITPFIKEGYTFAGWSTTAGGAVAYADGANYTANDNATLYAVWEGTAEVPINSATLSYENVTVGGTATPTITLDSANGVISSKTFEITSGSTYASVNASTGVVTGIANGTAVVKATITDSTGKQIITSAAVNVGTTTGNRYVWKQYNRNTNKTLVRKTNDKVYDMYTNSTEMVISYSSTYTINGTTLTLNKSLSYMSIDKQKIYNFKYKYA